MTTNQTMCSEEQLITEQFLEIIDKYEKCPRLNIAQNIFKAMESINWDTFIEENRKYRVKKVTNNLRFHWIAKQCELSKSSSVFSWFGPNRDEKIPLKYLLRLSIVLSVPLDTLLDASVVIPRNTIRKIKYPDMYDIVVEQYLEDPSLSIEEIANILGITGTTVSRHLKHYKESLV